MRCLTSLCPNVLKNWVTIVPSNGLIVSTCIVVSNTKHMSNQWYLLLLSNYSSISSLSIKALPPFTLFFLSLWFTPATHFVSAMLAASRSLTGLSLSHRRLPDMFCLGQLLIGFHTHVMCLPGAAAIVKSLLLFSCLNMIFPQEIFATHVFPGYLLNELTAYRNRCTFNEYLPHLGNLFPLWMELSKKQTFT